jgi:hypothetical protein
MGCVAQILMHALIQCPMGLASPNPLRLGIAFSAMQIPGGDVAGTVEGCAETSRFEKVLLHEPHASLSCQGLLKSSLQVLSPASEPPIRGRTGRAQRCRQSSRRESDSGIVQRIRFWGCALSLARTCSTPAG